jgi:hypothetical protein
MVAPQDALGEAGRAMSEENVEIVRRAFAQFEQGNFWVPEFFDPSVRIRWLDAVGTESETVGLQAMSESQSFSRGITARSAPGSCAIATGR